MSPTDPTSPAAPAADTTPAPAPEAPQGSKARAYKPKKAGPAAAPRKYPRPVAGEAPSTDKPARPYVRPVDKPAVGAGAVSAGGTMPATVGVSLKATPTSPFRPKLPQKKPPAKAPTAKGAVVSAASAAPVGPARVQVGAVPVDPRQPVEATRWRFPPTHPAPPPPPDPTAARSLGSAAARLGLTTHKA